MIKLSFLFFSVTAPSVNELIIHIEGSMHFQLGNRKKRNEGTTIPSQGGGNALVML